MSTYDMIKQEGFELEERAAIEKQRAIFDEILAEERQLAEKELRRAEIERQLPRDQDTCSTST